MSLSEYEAVGATSLPAFSRRTRMPSRVKGSRAWAPTAASWAARPTPPTLEGAEWLRVMVKERVEVLGTARVVAAVVVRAIEFEFVFVARPPLGEEKRRRARATVIVGLIYMVD